VRQPLQIGDAHPAAEHDQRLRIVRHLLARERPHQPVPGEQPRERARPLEGLVLDDGRLQHGAILQHPAVAAR
jgi:hypothetical protein